MATAHAVSSHSDGLLFSTGNKYLPSRVLFSAFGLFLRIFPGVFLRGFHIRGSVVARVARAISDGPLCAYVFL